MGATRGCSECRRAGYMSPMSRDDGKSGPGEKVEAWRVPARPWDAAGGRKSS